MPVKSMVWEGGQNAAQEHMKGGRESNNMLLKSMGWEGGQQHAAQSMEREGGRATTCYSEHGKGGRKGKMLLKCMGREGGQVMINTTGRTGIESDDQEDEDEEDDTENQKDAQQPATQVWSTAIRWQQHDRLHSTEP